MRDERREVLNRVRAALASVKGREPLPDYSASDLVCTGIDANQDSRSAFRSRLQAARGLAFDDPGALAAWLRSRGALVGYLAPELEPSLAASLEGFVLHRRFERAKVDEYAFGITSAFLAIAETGSIVLTDASCPSRLATLAPWIHVAVVSERRIFRHLSDALAELDSDPYTVWCTGPSKTADIEGILIEGVHGPGEQVALLVP